MYNYLENHKFCAVTVQHMTRVLFSSTTFVMLEIRIETRINFLIFYVLDKNWSLPKILIIFLSIHFHKNYFIDFQIIA
jgi:hypothetical protein